MKTRNSIEGSGTVLFHGLDYVKTPGGRVKLFEVNGSRSGFDGARMIDPEVDSKIMEQIGRSGLSVEDFSFLSEFGTQTKNFGLDEWYDTKRTSCIIPASNRIPTTQVIGPQSEGSSYRIDEEIARTILGHWRSRLTRSTEWRPIVDELPYAILKPEIGAQGRGVSAVSLKSSDIIERVVSFANENLKNGAVMQAFCPSDPMEYEGNRYAWSGRLVQWVWIPEDSNGVGVKSLATAAYRRLAPDPIPENGLGENPEDHLGAIVANLHGERPAIPVGENDHELVSQLEKTGLQVVRNILRRQHRLQELRNDSY